MSIDYGRDAWKVSKQHLYTGEMMYYLYLPIHMPDEPGVLRLPPRLHHASMVVWESCRDAGAEAGRKH